MGNQKTLFPMLEWPSKVAKDSRAHEKLENAVPGRATERPPERFLVPPGLLSSLLRSLLRLTEALCRPGAAERVRSRNLLSTLRPAT